MVAGSFAFQYSGISRSTKDFDIFVRPRDVRRTLDAVTRGFRTEVAFGHWLAKAYHGDKFIDVIFNSGNGVAEVDDEWFAHAVQEEVLGVPVKLSPAEEMIWSKSMIMEREAVRRRRRRPPAPSLQWPPELGPARASIRVELAHPAVASRPFRLHLPGRARLIRLPSSEISSTVCSPSSTCPRATARCARGRCSRADNASWISTNGATRIPGSSHAGR